MRQVAHIMGMPITVDIPCHNFRTAPDLAKQSSARSGAFGALRRQRLQGSLNVLQYVSLHASSLPSTASKCETCGSPEHIQVFEKVFNRFRQIDELFSPYKKDSELCRYQRGEIKKEDLSTEFKKIMQACDEAEKETDGYFSAYFSGKYDPSGYVKGWSIAETGKIIEQNGFKTYSINAGGDILAKSDSEKVWNIGIQDPRDEQKTLNKLSIKNGAAATSGNYERGKHIVNPKIGKPADKFLSVTVTGPDIIKADILATAIFAAEDLGVIKIPQGYQVFIV
jgi:thiamine biosynthesis lipoprotein